MEIAMDGEDFHNLHRLDTAAVVRISFGEVFAEIAAPPRLAGTAIKDFVINNVLEL